jgi:XapX domain-containing protein
MLDPRPTFAPESPVKLYLVSLGAGILVGVLYALMQVRSPAPPVVALVGLLGMLIGGQIVPPVQRLLAGEPVTMAWFGRECVPQITGVAPAERAAAARADADGAPNGGHDATDPGCKR